MKELEVQFPKKMTRFGRRTAQKVLKLARDNSEVRTGRLKRNWKIDNAKIGKKEVKTVVKNTTPYAHLVEDGHIKKDKNNKITGFTQRNHMFKNALKEVEDNLEDDFEKEFF